jgi:hypothetical protein
VSGHRLSDDDRDFRQRFEDCRISPGEFNHRAHVRLVYLYLCAHTVETAYARMRDALHAFLRCNDVDPAKYHDTLTRAWIMAVRHFMEKATPAASADEFIDANTELLDAKIMLTHYSAEHLFSADARRSFVEPDLDPIPDHDA